MDAPPDQSPKECSTLRSQEQRVREKADAAVEILAAMDFVAAASLLRIGHIRVTRQEDIQTACLRREGTDLSICLDASFCDRPQNDVTCILLHEILHHVMRHLESTGNIGSDAYLSNVVADAFINRLIHLIDPRLSQFFRDYYDQDKSPALFLRGRPKPPTISDTQMHRLLYQAKISEADLYDYFSRQGLELDPDLVLVGDHGKAGNPIDEGAIPELVEEIKNTLPASNEAGEVANKLEALVEQFVKSRCIDKIGNIDKVFRANLAESCKAQIIQTVLGDIKDLPQRRVFMPETVHRQDVISVMAGVDPFLWRSFEPESKHGSANVYLDVSGSMKKYLDLIYGCCIAFEEYLDTDIYLFSDKISPVTIPELRAGKVKTTHGTDFDCVIEHALDGSACKSILFTDGYAKLTKRLETAFSQSQKTITGVLTDRGSERQISTFCHQIHRLPAL